LLQDAKNEIEVVSKKKKKKEKTYPQTLYISVWARSLSIGHGCAWHVEEYVSGVEGYLYP
jgi:hypothetical protein